MSQFVFNSDSMKPLQNVWQKVHEKRHLQNQPKKQFDGRLFSRPGPEEGARISVGN